MRSHDHTSQCTVDSTANRTSSWILHILIAFGIFPFPTVIFGKCRIWEQIFIWVLSFPIVSRFIVLLCRLPSRSLTSSVCCAGRWWVRVSISLKELQIAGHEALVHLLRNIELFLAGLNRYHRRVWVLFWYRVIAATADGFCGVVFYWKLAQNWHVCQCKNCSKLTIWNYVHIVWRLYIVIARHRVCRDIGLQRTRCRRWKLIIKFLSIASALLDNCLRWVQSGIGVAAAEVYAEWLVWYVFKFLWQVQLTLIANSAVDEPAAGAAEGSVAVLMNFSPHWNLD